MYNLLVELIKKHRSELIIFFILIVLYFFLRLLNLTHLPIFTDEAIYIRWAQIGLHDPNWRYISLVDGKQPLFVWFIMAFLEIVKNPLLAGRLVSVVSGFFTLLGVVMLSWELFKNKQISVIAGLLYIFYPFAQVYDRMALMDGMVGTFVIWSTYFSVLLVRRMGLATAYTLGVVLGAGYITKSSALFSSLSLPFTLLLFDFKRVDLKKRLLKWIFLAGFAFVISQIMYNSLRLSPFFYIIAQKNATFVYPFKEWIAHPFLGVLSNTQSLIDWFVRYLNIYIAFILISFIFFKKFFKEKLMLLAFFSFPIVAYAFFGRVIFPRHIYFATLNLLPLVALGVYFVLEKIRNFNKSRVLSIVVVAACVVYPLTVSLLFAINPFKSPIPESDYNQYIRDWPAGWGVYESVNFFNQQSQNQKIFIATQGTFGLMPYSYQIFLNQNKNVEINGYWPINDTFPSDVLEISKKEPTYFVFYQPCPGCRNSFEPPASWPVRPVFKSPYGPLTVYEVIAP